MELIQIDRASRAPAYLQRAAKMAFVVGGKVFIDADNEHLTVQFENNDKYRFDPEYSLMHCLEALNMQRSRGFVVYDAQQSIWARSHVVVRVVFSNIDVRVQIGTSRWYAHVGSDSKHALCGALLNAFSDYYDAAIARYVET